MNFEGLGTVRREDFVFYARIHFLGEEIEKNVKCRVYLPVKITDPIELQFFPTEDQAKKLRGYVLWQYSVAGEIKALSGEPMLEFNSNEVFAPRGVQTAMHGEIRESKMVGYPVDFTVKRIRSGRSSDQTLDSADVNFWITPNTLLEPAAIVEHSYTGKVEVESVWKFSLEVDPQRTFQFNRHYRYRNNEEDETVSFSELVAQVTLKESAESSKIFETLDTLDGVLLLASLAERQRCVCLGWDAADSKVWVRQYVRNRVIPSDKPKSGLRDTLIDKAEFTEFMKTAQPIFASIDPQDPLRRALSFTVPFKDGTADGEFVGLYTALEIIVLQFRRVKDLEFVLPSNKWNKVRKDLKKYIDSMDLSAEHNDKKTLIQEKLSELNRVSFGTAFDQFCLHYSIDLSDLWPVVKSDSGASLSQVRNKLVHGEHFGPDRYEALMFALLHLRWTVERMLLAVLGWDAERSNVSSRTPLWLDCL